MAGYAVFCVFIILVAYLGAARILSNRVDKAFRARRGTLLSLYVERANLMPYLMNAARKHEPLPLDIHNSFVAARDRFAAAEHDGDVKDANADLDAVFASFFTYYASCGLSTFLKLRDDFDKNAEKIAFTSAFYGEATQKRNKIYKSPLRYGLIALSYVDKGLDWIYEKIKR